MDCCGLCWQPVWVPTPSFGGIFSSATDALHRPQSALHEVFLSELVLLVAFLQRFLTTVLFVESILNSGPILVP